MRPHAFPKSPMGYHDASHEASDEIIHEAS